MKLCPLNSDADAIQRKHYTRYSMKWNTRQEAHEYPFANRNKTKKPSHEETYVRTFFGGEFQKTELLVLHE